MVFIYIRLYIRVMFVDCNMDSLFLRSLLCQIHPRLMKVDVLFPGHEPARVDEVEHGDGGHHHGAVERDEVPLRRDEVAAPALQQLDGPVDAPDVDAEHGEDHGVQQRQHRAAHRVQQVLPYHPPQEIGRAEHEDGDRAHLEHDAGHHDVRAGLRVAVDLARGLRRHPSADSLDHQRDDIAGAEDPQVERRAEDGRLAS